MKNVSFEIIKKRIGEFSFPSQINNCLIVLDDIQESNQKDYPLWNILLLIKWCLMHHKNVGSEKHASKADVIATLTVIQEFEYANNLIAFTSKREIARSLRIAAYQQFWLQDHIANNNFDRQIVLYNQLLHKHDINKTFKLFTGFTIVEFLNYCYSVFIYFEATSTTEGIRYDGFLEEDYFETFKDKLHPSKISAFIKLLTLTSKEELEPLQKMTNEVYQLYETNFLSTKPFLLINGKIKTPHRAIFGQTCKYFIYDYLKTRSPDFSEEFGRRLEKYIQLGLEEAKLTYAHEKKLKMTYPNITKIVDFLVDDNVLIESKAIELNSKAAVLRYPELMLSTLKDSIVKAYCQMLSTAHAINLQQSFYGIIITHKETYIGFGQDAWVEFLQPEVEDFALKNKISLSRLPVENLCIIDVETWDYLVQAIIEYKCSICSVIDKAKENMHESINRKMLLSQVLNAHYRIERFNLSYLAKAHCHIDII